VDGPSRRAFSTVFCAEPVSVAFCPAQRTAFRAELKAGSEYRAPSLRAKRSNPGPQARTGLLRARAHLAMTEFGDFDLIRSQPAQGCASNNRGRLVDLSASICGANYCASAWLMSLRARARCKSLQLALMRRRTGRRPRTAGLCCRRVAVTMVAAGRDVLRIGAPNRSRSAASRAVAFR